MPRRNLARRFLPRYGVSQSMLEHEATYVAREAEDCSVRSTNELRERLEGFRRSIRQDEADVVARIGGLPEHQQLILRCMLARDFWHIVKLYQCYLCCRTLAPPVPNVVVTDPPESPETERAEGLTPFSEWLFDPAKR
jgi:hypothetical protein